MANIEKTKPQIYQPVIDIKDNVFSFKVLKNVLQQLEAKPSGDARQMMSILWAMNLIEKHLLYKELPTNDATRIFNDPNHLDDTRHQITYIPSNDGKLIIEYGSAVNATICDKNGNKIYNIHTAKHEGDKEALAHHHGNRDNIRHDIIVKPKTNLREAKLEPALYNLDTKQQISTRVL